MGTHELNNTELEQVWRMMLKDTFDQFITTQIGYSEEGRPACFGTGDGLDFCNWCPFQSRC